MAETHVRRRDLDEAAAILAMVDELGGAPLPQLTDTDLCVFSDTLATVLDSDVWNAWLALPDEDRVRLADLARDFLVSRRLLRVAPVPSTSGDGSGMHQGLRIQPKLAFILAARQSPSFVGICSVPGVAQPSAPRLFGIADETRTTPTLLMEQVSERQVPAFGHIRDYGLLLPERAAKVLATWMAGTLRDPAHPACVLALFTHPANSAHPADAPEQPPTVERLTVRGSSGGSPLRLEHLRSDGTYVQRAGLDEPALAALIAPALAAAAAPR